MQCYLPDRAVGVLTVPLKGYRYSSTHAFTVRDSHSLLCRLEGLCEANDLPSPKLPTTTSTMNILLNSKPFSPSRCLTARSVSSSPYGRTHVWKRRQAKLPNPVVPQFPQRVIRSDGSSFVHWTTSPRSVIKLTRDVTNNPTWNPGMWKSDSTEEESAITGRLGRFNRRFEGLGGHNSEVDWMAPGEESPKDSPSPEKK